jgi:hypothetical protein
LNYMLETRYRDLLKRRKPKRHERSRKR